MVRAPHRSSEANNRSEANKRPSADAIPLGQKTSMPHPAMSPNNVAVIPGGAYGLGFAAAMRFARLGMKVCIADLGADRLTEAATKLVSAAPGGGADIMARNADVSRAEDVS